MNIFPVKNIDEITPESFRDALESVMTARTNLGKWMFVYEDGKSHITIRNATLENGKPQFSLAAVDHEGYPVFICYIIADDVEAASDAFFGSLRHIKGLLAS